MADVTGRGSLPVPNHLETAGDRRMKAHGIGVGYLYPHEYEGSDVAQQYLPDELADRRYYHPSAEGSEKRIGDLMDARLERRAAGKPRRAPQPPGSGVSGIGDGMKGHTEARRKLAETQRKDAGDLRAGRPGRVGRRATIASVLRHSADTRWHPYASHSRTAWSTARTARECWGQR